MRQRLKKTKPNYLFSMELLQIIEQIQAERGNQVPRVALYMAIARKVPQKIDIKAALNTLVLEKKVMWGKTPHTLWFATSLDEFDRQLIDSFSDWTIEA